MASNRILKYAFSILKQPAGHSSIEKTVFSIENLYAYVNRIYILYICYHFENITKTITTIINICMASKPILKYAFIRRPRIEHAQTYTENNEFYTGCTLSLFQYRNHTF